jgi:DNA-binding NarL/FixJ family response regulator
MLTCFLEADPSFQVVANCSAVPEALLTLSRKRIDLVLLDHEIGDHDGGFQFVRQARDAGYAGRIFIVTAKMTGIDCVSALSQAVCGIFFKHNSPQLLVEAIYKVMAGQTWIDQRCIQLLAHAVAGERRERQIVLTDRELQVLKGVLGGLRNRQIGDQLSISEASVKSALQQLFVKTGVRSRSQLVRVALEEHGAEWDLRP